MDNFTERMLVRTKRRQELLASASLGTPSLMPITSTTIETMQPTPLPPMSPPLPPKSPPLCRERRTRLAELASRVDQWLEEDIKPKEKISTESITKAAESITQTSQQIDNISNVSSVGLVSTVVNRTKTIENELMAKKQQQSISQTNKSRFQQFRQNQSDSKIPPPWQSPNLAASTLSVAQRRALFEKNISASQNIKPVNTTVVTISLTKTSPVISNTIKTNTEGENNIPISNTEMTTPPRIPQNVSTPPSRRGTRPRMSPAIAALGNSSPTKRTTWTPPCIKNVLLKKQLNKELEDEQQQISENDMAGIAVATSSPINNSIVSPADQIAKSVGRVRFLSPPTLGSLYPDLSFIEDNNANNDNETIQIPLENQLSGCKRRSNGNSTLNISTTSSESIEDAENTEILSVKRSRSTINDGGDAIVNVTLSHEATTVENSSSLPTTTALSYNNLSMVTDSPLSQTSTSFTYYSSTDNPCNISDTNNPTLINSLAKKNHSLVEFKPDSECFDSKTIPHGFDSSTKDTNIEPSLVHTISIYRKQQQLLRLGGTPVSKNKCSESDDKGKKYQCSTLFEKQLNKGHNDEDDEDDDDEEDYKLQELEAAAERAWHLERTVVPEQDRIIDQATQALNICDVYRQRSGLRPELSSKFTPEHVHAERLLLIAGLRRTDAVREAQRLRVERTLLPGGISGKLYKMPQAYSARKILVIESLRVPILSSIISNSNNKTKFSAIEGMENQTRWPGGYRYFVCAIRAAATTCRPPVTAGTRPADALEESIRRFSVNTSIGTHGDDGTSYGYVEFITKKQIKSSGNRKSTMPPEAEGAPIMIHGLDDDGWKVTVEFYGLSPTATGDLDSQSGSNNGKEHDTHENKSVLDKLWSTVKTPGKDSKKHHAVMANTCIESPGGPSAVRNTVFRQLGYFVFSNGQVDRQQFTLNKVHQTGGISSISKSTGEETVRVRMRLLEEGEQYTCDDDEVTNSNSGTGYSARKLITLPSECKRYEGFLTLFDDHELRSTPVIERGRQWQHHSDISGRTIGGTTLWRRLWFRAEVNDIQQQKTTDTSNDKTPKQQQQKTIVLRYWMYPEHAEQQREPLGVIDLGRCLPPESGSHTTNVKPIPAAPALPDLCARPNTLRLFLYGNGDAYDDDYRALKNGVDDPLLLSADTTDERREWCDTVNTAVNAISEHRKWIKLDESTRLIKEKATEYEQQNRRQQEQQHTGAWPTTPGSSGKNFGKKKKLYK